LETTPCSTGVDRRHDDGNGASRLPQRPDDSRRMADDYFRREPQQFCCVSPYGVGVCPSKACFDLDRCGHRPTRFAPKADRRMPRYARCPRINRKWSGTEMATPNCCAGIPGRKWRRAMRHPIAKAAAIMTGIVLLTAGAAAAVPMARHVASGLWNNPEALPAL